MYEFIKECLEGKTDSSRHQITLYSLVIALHAKNVLELGVRSGNSTKPLLDALFFTKGKLTSVDIEKNYDIVNKFNVYLNWNYVIQDSIFYLKNLSENEFFDLIFIDDWHDGDHLSNEINLLEKHITPSSLVLIHDCMCYNTQPDYHFYLDKEGEFANGGPYKAVKQLNMNIWEFATIPVNNGLTILRKKGKELYF
jgi:predicted O-methyltransferase YrrM